MAKELVMPQMGYDMQQGTVVRWIKKEGDEVVRGEPVAEIATDKAVVEMESIGGGVLRKYGADGNELWTRDAGGALSTVVVASDGGVYAGGMGVLRKYDTNGDTIWTRNWPGAAVNAVGGE